MTNVSKMHIDQERRQLLSLDYLRPMVRNNSIIDVSPGGLLLGYAHDDGGILVIQQFSMDYYEVVAEFEGWEYILNANATENCLTNLHRMNDELKGPDKPFSEYMIPDAISILDARSVCPPELATRKLLIIGSKEQFIINRHSTKKYILELEKKNQLFPATVR
jgi:hypothetical protein